MLKLHFETIGQGPDIVMLHGWAIHSGIWQFSANRLAKEFRVTLIDLPGLGRSAILSDYTIENIIFQLLRIAPPSATWIGWSLGGLIATKFALLYPEKVQKLICVASSPCFVEAKKWPGLEQSVLQNFNEKLQIDCEATLLQFIMLQFYGLTLNKEMIRWFNMILFLYGIPKLQTLAGGLNILQNTDLRIELASLQCPLLYMLGKLDVLIPAKIAKHLEKLHTNIRTVIFPKASHALFLSHENEFIAQARNFIYE